MYVAKPRCSHCDSQSFAISELMIAEKPKEYLAVHCAKCGVVVSSVSPLNANESIENQIEWQRRIEDLLNQILERRVY